MPECGHGDDHCCFIPEVCQFLRDDGAEASGRRFVCTLREGLGSWERVYADLRYIEQVKPKLDARNIVDCGKWPRTGEKCHACGKVGS